MPAPIGPSDVRSLAAAGLVAVALLLGASPSRAAITTEPGWPVATGYSVSPSATAAQLDGDPELEVVIASQDTRLYAFDHDGTSLAGWPRTLGGALWPDPYANLCSSPAIGDLDGDGTPEIVVGCFDGRLYAFEPSGATYGTFPFVASFMIFSTPALGDIDDDPRLEIVFGDNHGKVWAINHDRTVVPGFPVSTPYVVRSSPALGDLDGDGKDEIVITADNSTYQLYALDGNGTALPGFPKYLWMSGAVSSPALGDVDRDGGLDIVVGSRDGRLHAFHSNGTYLAGWPFQAGYSIESSPALADLDGDPGLEIVVGLNDSKIAAYDPDGALLPGWPRATAYSVIASPSIGDVDADSLVDIVCPDNTGAVNAWHVDGSVVAGFPLEDATYTIYSSVLLEDLDRDGSLELLCGSNDHYVYCWDMGPGTYLADRLPWAEWRRDAANRANAGAAELTSVAAPGTSGASGTAALAGARATPNPFRTETTFSFASAVSTPGASRLRIFDTTGREVRRFERTGSNPVRWNGRDERGAEVPSGVFFYRVESVRGVMASGRVVRVN